MTPVSGAVQEAPFNGIAEPASTIPRDTGFARDTDFHRIGKVLTTVKPLRPLEISYNISTHRFVSFGAASVM